MIGLNPFWVSIHSLRTTSPQLLESDPRPIPLETFQYQKLVEYILRMVFAPDKRAIVVDEDSRLCEIVQGYASAGFQHMLRLHEDCGSDHNWLMAWEDSLVESVVTD